MHRHPVPCKARFPRALLPALLALSPAAAGQHIDSGGLHWPGFRGERASGVADGRAPLLEWSVEEGEGVLWRRELPGLSHASVVVHGERLFALTAERLEQEAELSSLYGSPGYGAGDPVADEGPHAWRVYCLDKRSGEILWERTAHEGVPKVKRHPKASHASSTPACDAERVVAFFGSEGLHAYDHQGELLWKRDLGVLDAGAPGQRDYQWGFASSPVLHEGKVVVQCDVQDQSFLALLDAATGEELWRVARDEDPSWCTPTVVDGAGERPAQIVANGYKHIGGYVLASGAELWKLSGGGDVPVPTPVAMGDKVFLTSSHGRMRPIYAVRLDARGKVEIGDEDTMAWCHPTRGVYMQTPLAYGEFLYLNSDGGVLACYVAETGEEVYRERIGDGASGFSGSPIAAEGRLFLTSEAGEVHVVEAGIEPKVLALNDLGETCLSTPALSEGVLYFRTRRHVVAIGAGGGEER